jgi:DNA-binding CsgD family transcriptional regulator
VQLRIAHSMPDAMGIGAFADRAWRELAATSETARKRTAETTGELTAQEAQVARLAREGLSNPEISARLFISARTVQHHLSLVFAKLAISSRNQLHRVLPADPDTARPHQPRGSAGAPGRQPTPRPGHDWLLALCRWRIRARPSRRDNRRQAAAGRQVTGQAQGDERVRRPPAEREREHDDPPPSEFAPWRRTASCCCSPPERCRVSPSARRLAR